jgi:Ca2+-binding EF-hand superfamily protein
MSIEDIRKSVLKANVRTSPCLFITNLFKKLDTDHSNSIDFDEFKRGLKYLGVSNSLGKADIDKLFAIFDRGKTGSISFSDFVIALRPPVSPDRFRVIIEAFEKLDVNKDGILSIEDFEKIYTEQAKRHPKYLSKEWNISQVSWVFRASA